MSRTFGVLLIALGLVGLVWGGFSYVSDSHDVGIGPVEMSVKEKKTIPVPPIAGTVAVVAGTALLVVGSRRQES